MISPTFSDSVSLPSISVIVPIPLTPSPPNSIFTPRYLADKQTSSLTETLFPVAMKNRLVHLTVASSIAF
jgi:hypothetical protein